MLRTLLNAGLILGLLAAVPARAQELRFAGPDLPLEETKPQAAPRTLEEFTHLALMHNPTLEQARAATWDAYGQFVQAGLYPNPIFGYMGDEIGNEGENGMHGPYVQQTFITGGKLRRSQAVAARERQRAEQALTAQQFRVVNAVRREYYAVLAAERLREIAEQLVGIAGLSLKITELRVKQQEGTRIDQLQAQVELERAQLALNAAENAAAAAWRRLRAVVGVPRLPAAPLAESLDENVPRLDWEGVRARILGEHPHLARARLGVARAQAALGRARVEPIPNITVQASTQYDDGSKNQFAGVQIGVPLPVFDKNQGNIISAEADLVRAAREVERLELLLTRALADVYRNYATSELQARRYREQILPAAAETLKLSRSAFEAGELSYLQLLTAQRSYAEAQQAYVQALNTLWQNLIALDGLLLVDGLTQPETVLDDGL